MGRGGILIPKRDHPRSLSRTPTTAPLSFSPRPASFYTPPSCSIPAQVPTPYTYSLVKS